MSQRAWLTSVTFVLTVAVSSASLFVVQPMCARIMLPQLGGSPSVWTTCMLFFQAGLMLGYLYAHASARIGIRAQAVLHLALVALACLFLPPFVGRPLSPENASSPTAWLLGMLLMAVGLPYLVLASSAPLLQVWFARSAGTGEREPYFLYAASNAGSLFGLLAYPLLLEPLLSLRAQSYVWSACFVIFAVATSMCAVVLWKGGTSAKDASVPSKSQRRSKQNKAAPVGKGTIAKWLFLAFLPSSLLLSVTVHLTADVSSIPLLWVVPLGVYLITYILAFSTSGIGQHRIWKRWLPLVILVLVLVLLTEATEPAWLIIVLHLLGLFWIGMVCHGELVRSRPPVTQLTMFYLCIAIGGMFGGVFNAIVAPAIFNRLVEYPAAIFLACLMPAFAAPQSTPVTKEVRSARSHWKWDVVLPILLTLITWGALILIGRAGIFGDRWKGGLLFAVPLVVCYTFSERPIRFGLAIGGLLLCAGLSPGIYGQSLERVRSFFGIHRITRDGDHRVLIHGNTEHGRQSFDPAAAAEPLAYYARSGPVGELFGALPASDSRLSNVAVLGLGAGTIAAYALPGQSWTFYEIDPSVVGLARRRFTYLQDAETRGAKVEIVTGDARYHVSRSSAKYGIIILDAFSSDSIPTHLFTREALAIYRERLKDDGILLVHYSSRFFELQSVLGALAKSANPPFFAAFREDLWLTDADRDGGKAPSKWAIFLNGGNDPILPALFRKGWLPIEGGGDRAPWTDDHANVLGALRFRQE